MHFTNDKVSVDCVEVNQFLYLKDGRIASCCQNGNILIFLKDSLYSYYVLSGHTQNVTSICQLEDGSLASASNDRSIKIWNLNPYGLIYTIDYAHERSIPKIVTLSKNRIATCSEDKTIKIWKGDSPYSNEPLYVLSKGNGVISFIGYIKEKEFLIACFNQKSLLMIWELKNYQVVSVVSNFECDVRVMREINKETVMIGGWDYNKKPIIIDFNVDKCVIENTIKMDYHKITKVRAFIETQKNVVLCACDGGESLYYNCKSKTKQFVFMHSDFHELMKLNEKKYLGRISKDSTSLFEIIECYCNDYN